VLLNRLEKLTMNNPIRGGVQRYFEAPRLRAMGGPMRGGRALEVGCGNGRGASLILERFGADSVDAFDLDPHMVQIAEKRLAPFGSRARTWQGDVTKIEAPDETYDAVFDFGIIHHVPDWRAALAEIHRVLVPGGRFYAEEILRGFIDAFPWRVLFAHPRNDRFDADDFIGALRETGFEIVERRRHGQTILWVVADKSRASRGDSSDAS
jgi:ubiquinone/menaquinone biosynthesis C-methylase UbiE